MLQADQAGGAPIKGELYTMRWSLPLLALLACLSPCTTSVAEGLSQLIGYVSSLDRSTQQYGVYLPAAPAPSPAGYPAAFHMHGYGWSVSDGFSDYQKRWAEDHGWILINLNARGPQFYEGVGDVETLNVVQDAHRRFGLDMSRLFVTGGSMGGTGAFRVGIRYPDVFAAAVGVDGWSDYREWHHHWYARTEQRNDIEEFRRPLLEAASPLYWAGRARWGSIQASVSGRDDVVLPENGLLLYNALLDRSTRQPGTYDNRLFLDYGSGHGGSFRIDQIYEYFLNRQTHPGPTSFLCESTLLTHGRMYWGSMLRLKVQGAAAALESSVDTTNGVLTPTPLPRDTAAPERGTATATVLTRNLSELAVHLEASPAAAASDVALYVDGFLAYQGMPRTVTLAAGLSPRGDLWGWQEVLRSAQDDISSGLRKSPELEGPIGEAFKRAFLVAYGAAGSPAEVLRNRQEAEDFARGWNGFMVHAEAVTAIPEDQVSRADLLDHSLILFATEQSSRLLREANARRELPVRVRSDGVIVKDPQWGDRAYHGSKFGAFVCYVNPLSDFREYLVVCRGQWATKPDGSARQGLEYDLEKLPWAYSDYVVFNTDLSELPHVLNVNNKPPVTCYEAGYFVEAGYFDQDWQPYRAAALDRIRAQGPGTAGVSPAPRLIHVESMRRTPEGLQVLVADAQGAPVPRARVTVQVDDDPPLSFSGNTGEDGLATFKMAGESVPCAIVNLMATGAEYDWQADRVWSTRQQGVELVVRASAPGENGHANVTVELGSDHAERLMVRLLPPVGQVDQPGREVVLLPNTRISVPFRWTLGDAPAGRYQAMVQVTAHHRPPSFARPVFVTVEPAPVSQLRITELTPVDIGAGGRWQVTVRLANLGSESEEVQTHLSLPVDRRYPPPQIVTVKPYDETTVVYTQPPGTGALERGLHPVRVWLAGHRGITATGEFTVK